MRMLNKVVQRPLIVTRKATAPSGVVCIDGGRGSCDMELLSHDLVTFRDEMENDHHSQTT